MVALITIITAVILYRASSLQKEAILENMESVSSSIANDIARGGETCIQMLNTIAITICYDERIPVEMRRARLQDALTMMVALAPVFISAYTAFPPDAFDGMDAAYAGAPGATRSGQLAFQITKASGSLEVKTYDRYQEALSSVSGHAVVTDPSLYMVNDKQQYLIDIRIPVALGNRDTGILGLQVELDDMQKMVEQAKLYGIGQAALYSKSGGIVAHHDTTKIGADFHSADIDMLGAEGIAAVADSLDSEKSAVIIHKEYAVVSYPFRTRDTGVPWSIVSFVPLKVVLTPIDTLIHYSVIFITVSGMLAAVIIFLTANSLTRRIVRVGNIMEDIAQGEGDLTKRLTIYAQDEIGDMGIHFNETLNKINNLVLNIKQQAGSLSEIGEELSTNMTETARNINEITVTIQSVKKQADNQANSVAQTNSTMRSIIEVIERFNQHIGAQSESIRRSSAAIEEMLANIDSVTQTLVKNDENVKKLAQASDAGRVDLQGVSSAIQEIAKQSVSLLEITTLMNNIAGQTNLLAMNAAIEAAHAGDSGKGFAVVADEIRNLAESSGKQSKTIASVLKNIKESIDKIAKSADGVIERFEVIDHDVRTVSEQETEIRNSMEEQGTGSKQILEYITTLNNITHTIEKDSDDMLAESREVIEESKNLERLTQEITRAMNDTSSEADEINAAVDRVSVIGGENKRHIEILISEISKFKTGSGE
jgi:methyl-accepting chemotaxis protein